MPALLRSPRLYLSLGIGTSALALIFSFLPPLLPGLGLAVILLWLFSAPGLALLPLAWHYTTATKTLLTLLTGPVLLMLISIIEAWFTFWEPRLTLGLLAAGTLASCVWQLIGHFQQHRLTEVALPADKAEPRRARRTREPIFTVALVVLLAAVIGAIVCSLLLGDATPTPYGLLLSGPAGYTLLGIIALVLGVTVWAIYQRNVVNIIAGIVATILTLRIPTALVDQLPIYGWTYKHLGVVDYIMTYGSLAHGLDVYNAWPGLFTFTAWLVQTSGISVLSVASWWILAVHLLQAPIMYMFARELRASHVAALTAAFLAEIFNWIAQDYYSPQSIVWLLGILFLTLALRARRAPGLIWWTIPLYIVIVVTHQLTPYWLLIAVFLLCVFKIIRPRWFFVPLGIIAAAWLALNYGSVAHYGLFSGFDLFANASRPSLGTPSAGYLLTENSMRGTALLIWLSTAALLFWRLRYIRREQLDRSVLRDFVLLPLALLVAPFALLGGQSYGGEAIFRVLLYSIPVCAVVIGAGILEVLKFNLLGSFWFKLRCFAVAVIIVLVGLMGAHNTYAPWFNNVITAAGYKAFTQIYAESPSNAMLISFGLSGPGRMNANYVRFAKASDNYFEAVLAEVDPELILGNSFKDPAVERQITATLQNENRPVVLAWLPAMDDYAAYYGAYPRGAYQNLIRQLEQDPAWESTTNTDEVKVFQLKGTS